MLVSRLDWLTPPSQLSLAPGQVHLWRVDLLQADPAITQNQALLSAPELTQASRFHFDRDRRRYIVSHAFLRSVLAYYLGLSPESIAYSTGAHGKPGLAQGLSSLDVRFNLAHSNELAILGLTLSCEIGVDLEYHRPLPEHSQIASRFFSPAECAVLQALPEQQQESAFFNAWTRKEAYLKALGDGLARPLDSFSVSLAPGETPRLLHVADQPGESERWRFIALQPEPGYTAAVVIEAGLGSESSQAVPLHALPQCPPLLASMGKIAIFR